jgi:hypothetical protein
MSYIVIGSDCPYNVAHIYSDTSTHTPGIIYVISNLFLKWTGKLFVRQVLPLIHMCTRKVEQDYGYWVSLGDAWIDTVIKVNDQPITVK